MRARGLGMGWILGVLVASQASAAESFLHVHVQEGGGGETVRVNLPLDMVEGVLPLLKAEGLQDGRLTLDPERVEGMDLRRIWEAVREGRDGEFVTVEGRDERIRVARSGKDLIATVDSSGTREKVNVRIPLAVVDALFSGEGDSLDLVAAVRAMGEHAGGDLVRIEDGETRVRVWIDRDQDGR
jgi:hypothetical protein